ncbi:SNARE protein [Lithospermum erythrorhizon]|uniref:SNARE protein n=1 Tax=Lithospermum erythrorhizon TaxID=34254 RepID=A0AAV3Q986_LITER
MNNLMTKSFLSYVDLKKQAMNDLEAGHDVEMGQLDPADEKHLSTFFQEVSAIQSHMEQINCLLLDLHHLNEETKSTKTSKDLRGIRDRINSNSVSILRKAKIIKTRLELLDKSNLENRKLGAEYKEGTSFDRTRMSVTNGLRLRLKDLMNEFQNLREKIALEHKEGLRKRYYSEIGEEPSEEMIQKMVSGAFEGKQDLVLENQERHEAVKEIQKSLTELHQVFLDMAVMVETQGEQMNNIEQNVFNAGNYVKDGTQQLDHAQRLKKKKKIWAFWIGVVLLVLLLVCLVEVLP